MNPFNQNLLPVQDNLPLGSMMNSYFDIETMTANNLIGKGKWFACNGRDRNRTTVDSAFAAAMPHGVFTSTARTLAATPASNAIGASPTYFVASAAAGTTAGQYSTDGATWSQTTLVSPASCQVNSVFWNGIRWFFGCSGSSHVCVTSADNPNSTWTECTGDTTSTLKQAFAYISSLALTVFITDAASTSCYTIPDGSTTATARTKTSSTPAGIGATASKYFIITSTAGIPLQTSTNGTTWTDSNPGGFGMGTPLGIASDGQQTVVVLFATYFLVSNDNGASWQKVYPPQEAHVGINEIYATAPITMIRINFTNGKFFATFGGAGGTVRALISTTGRTWFVENIGSRGAGAVTFADIAYKGGTYAMVKNSTAALSATEDMSQFRMPAMVRAPEITSLQIAGISMGQDYVKVAL